MFHRPVGNETLHFGQLRLRQLSGEPGPRGDGRRLVSHGGDHDGAFYDEALRRGHFLLTANFGDIKETRAAETIDAATPIDLDKATSTWRADGWAPPAAPAPGLVGADPVQAGSTVRIYEFIG